MADPVTRLVRNKEGHYYIISRYSGGMGWGNGLGCWKLSSVELDGHYVLMKEDFIKGGLIFPFKVLCLDKKGEIDEILYKEAKSLGNITAEKDKNALVEILNQQ